jgi:AraC-like DNA-binding protein
MLMNFAQLKSLLWTRSVKGNYYRKSMILVLIITSLPTAAIAISTYFIGINQIETEVYHKNKYQLEQVFQRLNEQFTQLELIVDKGTANPIFDEKLRDTDFLTEIPTMYDIYSSLSVLQSTNPMISRIDLYLSNQHLLVSNDKGAIRIDDDSNRSYYESVLTQPEKINWTNITEHLKGETSSFPYVLIHKIPIVSTRPYGALFVYLNKSLIDREITQLNPYENGVSFIVKPDGEWITAGTTDNQSEEQLEALIRDKMITMHASSDSFTINWKRMEYSVAYETFSRTGWRYMIATPLSQLTAPISLTSKLMLLVSISSILIAAVLSWFASQRMYKPIRRLVQLFGDSLGSKPLDEDKSDELKFIENKWLNITRESRVIQSLLEENQIDMKKGFLLQLVQDHLYFFSERELRERMEVYGWEMIDKSFVLLLIQLSPFVESSKRFLEGDEQLVTFAAANIIEELSADKEQMEVINFHNLSISLLISFEVDKPLEQVKSEIYKFSGELIDVTTKLLGAHVSVGVSKIVNQVKNLPKALNEVKQYLHFRNVEEQGQILSVDDFIPHFKEILDYPFHIEKEIIQSIQMGAENETIEKLEAFIRVLKQNTGKAFQIQQYMAQLLGSILRAMMQLGVTHESVNQGINLYEQMFKLREIGEMNHWFVSKVIQPFIKTLSEKQGIEMKQTIQRAITIINQEYMKELSLEFVSERIGMFPKRLSAVFAQVTGRNFIEYVTDVRMEKSKELLVNTDLKVNDIAVRVGYQPSYFNKIFKKSEGMTPGEYREYDNRL